jgi:UrcA family protein
VRNIVAQIGCDLGLIEWSPRFNAVLEQEEATMKKAIQIALVSALITTGIIKAAPALAESPNSQTNISLVRTGDLDLRSAEGQRTLDRRLAHAAREVCGTASDVDVVGKNEVRKCRDETLAKARGQREAIFARRNAVIGVTAAR